MRYLVPVLLGLILSLTGCAFINKMETTHPQTELLVKYSTLKMIEQSSNITATNVLHGTQVIEDYLEGNPIINIKHFQEEAEGVLGVRRMAPADQLVVKGFLNLLIDILQQDIERGIQAGNINEHSQLLARTFINWVEQAATLALER